MTSAISPTLKTVETAAAVARVRVSFTLEGPGQGELERPALGVERGQVATELPVEQVVDRGSHLEPREGAVVWRPGQKQVVDAIAAGAPAALHWKVTACARVTEASGEKVVLLVPVVTLFSTAHATAFS